MKSIKNIKKGFLLLSLSASTILSAQNSESTNSTFSNGTIVSSENATMREEFRIVNKPYDETMIGVFYEDNSKAVVNKALVKHNPIVSSGTTYIKYNSENGTIKKGDPLTSSSEAGVAMKAVKSGMIIGIALEDATSNSGLIKTRILIQYVKQ